MCGQSAGGVRRAAAKIIHECNGVHQARGTGCFNYEIGSGKGQKLPYFRVRFLVLDDRL